MALFNFGSINIDHVYRVPHLVQPGETLASAGYEQLLGGKGANQSVALARAGASVCHVGRLGRQDGWAIEMLEAAGVDVSLVEQIDAASGHAVIQVDDAGENAIVLHGGANRSFNTAGISACLARAEPGDWLLMQNECNAVAGALRAATDKQMQVAMNPAPMTPEAAELPLENCQVLILNEVEARGLADADDAERALPILQERYPDTVLVLTLGGTGALVCEQGRIVRHEAFDVEAIDTTGAGDTFVGFFLAAYCAGESSDEALRFGCAAAALSVTRAGATASIPQRDAVDRLLASAAR